MTTKATLLQAVRAKCLDCSCYQPSEVRLCPATRCALWPFRLGKDPNPSTTRGFAKPVGYTSGPDQVLPARDPESQEARTARNTSSTRTVLTFNREDA